MCVHKRKFRDVLFNKLDTRPSQGATVNMYKLVVVSKKEINAAGRQCGTVILSKHQQLTYSTAQIWTRIEAGRPHATTPVPDLRRRGLPDCTNRIGECRRIKEAERKLIHYILWVYRCLLQRS